MEITITAAPEPRADAKVWLAVIGSIIGAFVAVLNIQITNASLPDIQGGSARGWTMPGGRALTAAAGASRQRRCAGKAALSPA